MTKPRGSPYPEVIEGLGNVDPELFERAMCDLLRNEFPTLVPLSGGHDGGMDGAIADGQGEPYPLIVTTGRDVARNLRGSLEKQKELGRAHGKAIFVTSQSLTPYRRRKLHDLARVHDVVLVQVYDREAIADRLLADPRWLKELLGLTMAPSALRDQPESQRPYFDILQVGRESDLQWLRETKGDRLFFGEPGSGKTFLLRHLAREGWGLFLASDDEVAIIDAVDKQKPRVVIVDDAHRDPEKLVRLKGLRKEIEADFDIAATTWTGRSHLNAVAAALGVAEPGPQAHRLELMTRDELVEVVHAVGIVGDERFVRFLVDQAGNKPGLATTLAGVVLAGGEEQVREFLTGKALAKEVLGSFRPLVGDRAEAILAGFALGGDRGMTMVAVAEGLPVPVIELRNAVIDLAAGGVLKEVGEDALAVWPQALRPALIGSVFFRGPTSLSFRSLLDRSPDFGASVGELLDAAARGARVPPSLLRELVLDAQERQGQELFPDLDSEEPVDAESLFQRIRRATMCPPLELWRKLAGLDRSQAHWVLEQYPQVVEIASAALEWAPEEVIPRLLRFARAAEDHRGRERALEPLRDWVSDITELPSELLARRRCVAHHVQQFIEETEDRQIGLEALAITMSPIARGTSRDPGAGRTFQIQQGVLPTEQLQGIREIWEEVRGVVGRLSVKDWSGARALLAQWADPGALVAVWGSPAAIQLATAFARRLIEDLTAAAAGSPGVLGALRLRADRLGITSPEPIDPDFHLLFPGEYEPGEHLGGETRPAELAALADRWAVEPPEVVASRLASYHQEADATGLLWPWRALALCLELAARVEEAGSWLDAFLVEGSNGAYLRPFLERLVSEGLAGWESWVERCLAAPLVRDLAMELILSHPDPPAGLLDQALADLAENSHLVETLCLQGRVGEPMLIRLLQHSSASVAIAAAVGTWCGQPQGQVPLEIGAAWREAVLRAQTQEMVKDRARVGDDFWLTEIFSQEPALALEWLERMHLSGERPPFVFASSLLHRALTVLTFEQRAVLLHLLDASWPLGDVLPRVVQRDPTLYRQVVANAAFREMRLTPLTGMPDVKWWDLAGIALEAGEEPGRVAGATFGSVSYVGSGREHWEKWRSAFAERLDDPHAGIRAVARAGVDEAEKLIAMSAARERKAAM